MQSEMGCKMSHSLLVSLLPAPQVGRIVFYPRDALATAGGRKGAKRLLEAETLPWWQLCRSKEELEVVSTQGKR